MKHYVFENKGVIDPRSITTFGVSSKENASPIGFFGTGLKYAIAVLLRLGCQVHIITGGKRYDFGTERAKVRVDHFDFVTMNGQPLGFTTDLGKTWEAWQAFRELACNTMDEGGTWYATDGTDFAESDQHTYIIVSGSAFAAAWAERDSIILPMDLPVLSSDSRVNVHKGTSKYVYYRGVRAMQLPKQSMYTYDVREKLVLTEDRTVAAPWLVEYCIARMAAMSTCVEYLKNVLVAHPLTYWDPRALNFASINDASKEFHEITMEYARTFHPTLNESARKLVTDNNIAAFAKDEALDLDRVDKERLRRANEFLLKMGYSVTDYPIVVTKHLGQDVLGRAQDGTIYISKRTLMMGTKMLAGTLLEEYIHLKHGHDDCTRGMQNFLFDALISSGERVTGMPL
jgi:hypothetical protein